LLKVSRKKQKAETRQKLMDVTREVAKLAGIAPTSFYRHFHDMEGLGLALIEEHGEGLVTLMHDVRDQTSNGRSLIRASVETLFEYIFSNQGISRMILQESMARESVFREAAEKLFSSMSSDLAEFLVLDAEKRGVPMSHPELAANSAVAILFTTGIALLNTPVSDRDRYIEAAIIKLRMIMRGAEAMGQTR
jgi:AcrR family transcriptional regulator